LSKEEKMKLREANKNNKGNNEHKKDQWAFTIGDAQYQWLQETLENSKAKFKFVFGHHVMGSSRGAIEWADKFEWGGKDRRGMNQFKQYRPNWKMPIHELFVKNKVTAFLQGHDHIFVRQELDGIAYITCPMCGDPGYNAYNSDAYLTGDKLSNTGHLKMIVTNNDVEMHYIKSVLPKDEAAQGKNGNIVYAWSFVNKKTISHA
jgi:predicted phosphodiesterase